MGHFLISAVISLDVLSVVLTVDGIKVHMAAPLSDRNGSQDEQLGS